MGGIGIKHDCVHLYTSLSQDKQQTWGGGKRVNRKGKEGQIKEED